MSHAHTNTMQKSKHSTPQVYPPAKRFKMEEVEDYQEYFHDSKERSTNHDLIRSKKKENQQCDLIEESCDGQVTSDHSSRKKHKIRKHKQNNETCHRKKKHKHKEKPLSCDTQVIYAVEDSPTIIKSCDQLHGQGDVSCDVTTEDRPRKKSTKIDYKSLDSQLMSTCSQNEDITRKSKKHKRSFKEESHDSQLPSTSSENEDIKRKSKKHKTSFKEESHDSQLMRTCSENEDIKRKSKKHKTSFKEESHDSQLPSTCSENGDIKRKSKKHKRSFKEESHDSQLPSTSSDIKRKLKKHKRIQNESEESPHKSHDNQLMSTCSQNEDITRKSKKHKRIFKEESHDSQLMSTCSENEDIERNSTNELDESVDIKKKRKKRSIDIERDRVMMDGCGRLSQFQKFRDQLLQDIDHDMGKTEEVTMETLDEVDAYEHLHKHYINRTEELEKLREDNIKWKEGRWSKQEIDILKQNVIQFMKEYGIQDMKTWLFDSDKSERRGFYKCFAKNIKRPLFAVYRKVVRTFDDQNYIGTWSTEMEKELIRLHHLHGNKWVEIGKGLGVSGQMCYDHFRVMKKEELSEGRWTKEEESSLLKAFEHYGIDWKKGDCCLPDNVTWDLISKEVGTRSGVQCRRKWLFVFAWQLQGGEVKWNLEDDLKLIEILGKDESIEDEEEFNWEELADGWPSARNRYQLRSKWSAVKRFVPRYQFKTFQECLDYLFKHRVPMLREQIARTKTEK